MNIPASIATQVKENASPVDNAYFYHAESAMKSLEKVTLDTFCYDHVSMAANTLERIYKGLLQAAVEQCDCYQLPSPNFLTADHDILGMVLEIKRSFPDVFPYQDRSQWRDTKAFLRDLRMEYSNARYTSYPTYDEFCAIRSYVKAQFDLIYNYVKEGNLSMQEERDFGIDY